MPAKKTFISHAQRDIADFEELRTFLAPLVREQKIAIWSEADLQLGETKAEATKKQLMQAEIIILLVSSHFLAEDRTWEDELKNAMLRHENGEAVIIPIILRACDWRNTPFKDIKKFPTQKDTISIYTEKDQAWLEIVNAIRAYIEGENVMPPPPLPVTNSINPELLKVPTLVGNARLNDALNVLKNHAPDFSQEVTLLSGRLKKLDRDMLLGIISSQDENMERNKIAYAILALYEKMGQS